jgi:hypothetical protein
MPHEDSPMDPNSHITLYAQVKGKPDPVKAHCTINPGAQQVRPRCNPMTMNHNNQSNHHSRLVLENICVNLRMRESEGFST